MRHSTALVNELNTAKRLILKHFELVIVSLMHVSGLMFMRFRIVIAEMFRGKSSRSGTCFTSTSFFI